MPCHGISTGRRSAAFVVRRSWSRLSASPIAGSELKNSRLFASVSATALAPFMRAMAYKSCCRRLSMVRSACSRSETVTAGCDVRVPITRLSLAVLTELEMMSCCTLNKLSLGDLGLDIDPEAAMRVSLRGLHLAQPALVGLQDFGLIGDRQLGIHNDRKIKSGQVSQDSRKGCIRQLLQADKRVQNAVNVEISVSLIHDAYIGDLLAGAAVLKLLLSSVWAPVRPQGIECSFGFNK